MVLIMMSAQTRKLNVAFAKMFQKREMMNRLA
jgi:hypothetical protein